MAPLSIYYQRLYLVVVLEGLIVVLLYVETPGTGSNKRQQLRIFERIKKKHYHGLCKAGLLINIYFVCF